MKTNEANRRRLDILGNGDCSSDREIFAAVLKRWRQKLGYCSILATVPAILATHVSEARSDEAKTPEASVAGEGIRRSTRPKMSCSTPALLKRQSEFLLPHQKGNFAMLAAALGGTDDCPGAPFQAEPILPHFLTSTPVIQPAPMIRLRAFTTFIIVITITMPSDRTTFTHLP